MMEQIALLHPAAQITAVLGIAAFACVAVYSIFKVLREM